MMGDAGKKEAEEVGEKKDQKMMEREKSYCGSLSMKVDLGSGRQFVQRWSAEERR